MQPFCQDARAHAKCCRKLCCASVLLSVPDCSWSGCFIGSAAPCRVMTAGQGPSAQLAAPDRFAADILSPGALEPLRSLTWSTSDTLGRQRARMHHSRLPKFLSSVFAHQSRRFDRTPSAHSWCLTISQRLSVSECMHVAFAVHAQAGTDLRNEDLLDVCVSEAVKTSKCRPACGAVETV